MHSENFASDLQFGSRIGQDVKVLCGERQIFAGKWQAGFHEQIISHAFQEGKPVTVLRARDEKLLFQIRPQAIWRIFQSITTNTGRTMRMTDKRYAQVLLYNAFGYFNNRDWKPGSHQEIQDAEAWTDGRFTEDELLTIANGNATEQPEPKTNPRRQPSNPNPNPSQNRIQTYTTGSLYQGHQGKN